jgi:hypothetical protein
MKDSRWFLAIHPNGTLPDRLRDIIILRLIEEIERLSQELVTIKTQQEALSLDRDQLFKKRRPLVQAPTRLKLQK